MRSGIHDMMWIVGFKGLLARGEDTLYVAQCAADDEIVVLPEWLPAGLVEVRQAQS
jgi:hypothetical protein